MGGNGRERKTELAIQVARNREGRERLPARRALEHRGVGWTIDAQPPSEKRPQRQTERAHQQHCDQQRATHGRNRNLGQIG
jgi:hypothetical protein